MESSAIEARFSEIEARVRTLEERLRAPGGTFSEVVRKTLSAKEFLISKKPRTETQKLLALCYFLERYQDVEFFNVADIEAAFRQAREKVPKNINDAVNKNVARGFLMENKEKKDAKKAWQLTSTGERFVEDEMVSNGK